MKNKKIIIIIVLIAIILGGFGFYFFTREDKVTSLNLFEKQWIENNKNNIIDMSIVDNVPVLSYAGEGLILDFLDSLNKETNLSFNKISYKLGDENKNNYSFNIVDNVNENDILIYEDNYVILTKNETFSSIDKLKDLNIGVLNEDLSNVNNYLYGSSLTYKTYQDKNSMINEFNKSDTKLDGIVLLKTVYLEDIIKNNYKIAFNISDYKKYCVLSLGDIDNLNNILRKYYKKWSIKNYEESYNKYLSKNYLNLKNVNDSENVKFRSKRYVYGFIENAPYDTIFDNKFSGINHHVLSNFSTLTNAEISYKKYKSITDLVNAFNSNEIDLFYGINSKNDYKIDISEVSPIVDNKIVILKHSSNDKIITSIKSVDKIVSLENSSVTELFTKNDIDVSAYSNMKDLIENVTDNDIIALDMYTYNYYISKLHDFIIAYHFDIDDSKYIVRNISDNTIFADFLDFFIKFNDTQKYVSLGLKDLMLIDKAPYILKKIAIVLGIIVGILLIILSVIKLKPNKKRINLSKEDKLRYIDALTSLKNRNYLNSTMEKWDSTDVYPQTIIIIDLNNVAYINDNYGHNEGDEVIREAANLLINHQLENSEIIRTNGNEFLIYLVGYDEKQVVSYMRKLNKELKELKHGFGAAIGYSMINDEIKTIDDAINEATLDMKNNKEETRE